MPTLQVETETLDRAEAAAAQPKFDFSFSRSPCAVRRRRAALLLEVPAVKLQWLGQPTSFKIATLIGNCDLNRRLF